jgi:hypothetical protein
MKKRPATTKNRTKRKPASALPSQPKLDLQPCPFCGATHEALDKANGKGVYAYENAPSSDMQTWLHVVCLECGGAAPSVKAWNARSGGRASA